MLAGDLREGAHVGRVAGHGVDPVHAHQARLAARAAQQLVEVLGVFETEALHGGAVRARHLGAVVDRLVCARVEEDRARPREHGDRREVDVGDRRQHQRVRAAQQRGEALLDLLVQRRAAQQPRPARMRTPRVQVRRHRLDDLAVQIEPEVVAGREVRQPPRPHADHASVDLLDHGVHHRMRACQRREVAQRLGGVPARRPAVVPVPAVPIPVVPAVPFAKGSRSGAIGLADDSSSSTLICLSRPASICSFDRAARGSSELVTYRCSTAILGRGWARSSVSRSIAGSGRESA